MCRYTDNGGASKDAAKRPSPNSSQSARMRLTSPCMCGRVVGSQVLRVRADQPGGIDAGDQCNFQKYL